MRMLLETLAHQGFDCCALTGTFSPAPGDTLGFGSADNPSHQFARHGITQVKNTNIEGFRLLSFVKKGVNIQMLGLDDQMASHLHLQELALNAILPAVVRETKPNIILTWIRVQAMTPIADVAERSGIPMAAYLATAKPLVGSEVLRRIQRVLVPSLFLSEYYQKQYGIECEPLRPIVPILPSIESRCRARFVTMVNPAPEKGVTMLYALARRALRILPQARFLIVEGRWTRSQLRQSGMDLMLPNIIFKPNNVSLTQVFLRTSVLLHPSYWEEGFGRTILEAQAFGIPVLASRRGGTAEALNGAGFLIDIPDRLTREFRTTPSPEDLRPWIEHLTVLLTDSQAREEASRSARRAAKELADRNIKRAISLFSSMAQ